MRLNKVKPYMHTVFCFIRLLFGVLLCKTDVSIMWCAVLCPGLAVVLLVVMSVLWSTCWFLPVSLIVTMSTGNALHPRLLLLGYWDHVSLNYNVMLLLF